MTLYFACIISDSIYANIPQNIPQEQRAEINRSILASLKTSAKKLPAETVYNSYTGLGGLHGLDRKDFNSYNDYARAKKEFEMGQFFTPHDLCARMVALASPDPSEMVLDMCCEICNFMNHLPNLYNAYGFDIDPDAVTVARYLYPQAHIEECDLRRYDPGFLFDLLLGNPPYNLDFDGYPSQLYFCRKACDLLNPGGLMLIVVPHTFMLTEFWNKRQISEMETMFSFLGQVRLPDDAFAASGVERFGTKIMAFLRKSEHIEMRPYEAEYFLSFEELGKKIEEAREAGKAVRMKLRREADEMTQRAEREFQYKIDKYLFELKTHPRLRKHYNKSVALVSGFRNQKPPTHCTVAEYEEWKRRRLTRAKVLAVLRRHIRRQNEVPRKEIALVKTSYGYKLKAYAPHLLDKIERREVSFRELVAAGERLPELPRMNKKQKEQYRQAGKLIARKRKEFLRQQAPFSEMVPDPRIDAYIDRLRFRNKELQECEFTPLQKQDMGLLFQKTLFPAELAAGIENGSGLPFRMLCDGSAATGQERNCAGFGHCRQSDLGTLSDPQRYGVYSYRRTRETVESSERCIFARLAVDDRKTAKRAQNLYEAAVQQGLPVVRRVGRDQQSALAQNPTVVGPVSQGQVQNAGDRNGHTESCQ